MIPRKNTQQEGDASTESTQSHAPGRPSQGRRVRDGGRAAALN